MVSTGLFELDRLLNGTGYPEKSTILIVGPPGIGKEGVGYWFVNSGLNEGDFCLYITTLAVSEVVQDLGAFHIDVREKRPALDSKRRRRDKVRHQQPCEPFVQYQRSLEKERG